MRKIVAVVALGLGSSLAGFGQAAPVHFNTAGAGAKQADIEAAVRLICPAGKLSHGKDGNVSGCSVCPRGTGEYGDKADWELYAETPGHFTSAKDENLVLDGNGCESHASNFGGSYVFTLNAGKAKLLRYDQALITDQCLKFAFADGRDGLVCQGGGMNQGQAEGEVMVVSFDRTGKPITKELIHSTDTTETCGVGDERMVGQSALSEFHFLPARPANNAESTSITGLSVKATSGNLKCSQVESERKTKKPAAAIKTYIIEFNFDGRQFKVAPASRAALARFSAD